MGLKDNFNYHGLAVHFTVSTPAAASYMPFNSDNVNINVGTQLPQHPQAAFVVTNGNIGIGTWTASGGSLIVATGNVGIGTLVPGVQLDTP